MTERCLLRGKTSGRVDDNPESLVKRFKTHMETSMPVIQLFDNKGMVRRYAFSLQLICRIDGNRTREEVAADAMNLLKELFPVCSTNTLYKTNQIRISIAIPII